MFPNCCTPADGQSFQIISPQICFFPISKLCPTVNFLINSLKTGKKNPNQTYCSLTWQLLLSMQAAQGWVLRSHASTAARI